VAEFPDSVDTLPPPPPPPPPPTDFALTGIFPNPTVAMPYVVFSLESGRDARLELVDLLGRVVFHRDLGSPGPGRHQVLLDRSHTPPGVYWLRLLEANRAATARVVLLR
jgi:hypothetical protein